ncbi:MAG: WbuC family cupin fold metalloprotein [Sandaracinaceae bacterium]
MTGARSRRPSVVTFGDALFRELGARATTAPRLRTNHDFHLGPSDPSQRFLNVLARGTYVPPHRHVAPPKSEAFVVLRGEIGFFLFDDDGRVREARRLGDPTQDALPCGIDLLPGVWHSLTALSEVAVCYEVKAGPYEVGGDKVLAPWAPPEGDPRAPAYLAQLVATL